MHKKTKVGLIASLLVCGISHFAIADSNFELAPYELQSADGSSSVWGTLVVDKTNGPLDSSNIVDFSITVESDFPFVFTPANSRFALFEVIGDGMTLEVPGVSSIGVNSVVLSTDNNVSLPGCSSCEVEMRFESGLFETADYSRINYTVVDDPIRCFSGLSRGQGNSWEKAHLLMFFGGILSLIPPMGGGVLVLLQWPLFSFLPHCKPRRDVSSFGG